MYLDFFGLRCFPFSATLDVSSYFASGVHEHALSLLKSCVTNGDSFAVLFGPTGTGKTLLSHMLIDAIESNPATVFITNTHLPNLAALYQTILYDLSLPYEGLTEQELRLRLTDVLIERFRTEGKTLLFVDEAQHLTIEQLEELRLLSNLEGRKDRAVQIFLFGGEGLARVLSESRLEPLRQRIAAVATLRPLDMEQTVDFIQFEISRAGGSSSSILTASALADIYERSGGVPRRINQLCHRALLEAFEHDSGTVDSPHVMAASAALWIEEEPKPRHTHHSETSLAASHRTAIEKTETADPAPYLEVGAGIQSPMTRGSALYHEGEEEPTVIEPESVVERRTPVPPRHEPSRGGSKILQLHGRGKS